jgi:hypothetical protein
MSDLYNSGLKFVTAGLTDNAFYRCFAYGIVFSFLMTLIIGNFAGTFALETSFPWIKVVKQQEYWVGIVFVSFSLVFAFFGYVNDIRARDDILTPLRKKLVGMWKVDAQTWTINGDEVKQGMS